MKAVSPDPAQNQRIYRMAFAQVYPLYLQKAQRKGRSQEEVDQIISWLTGYDQGSLRALAAGSTDFETFFAQAPRLNPAAGKITGTICGYRVEEIPDPVVQKVRWLDKLVDELAKGRPMDKILRQE